MIPKNSRACLETPASAASITAAYSARSGRGVDGAAAVAALLTQGDPGAQAVWDCAVDALATALAAVTTCFAPASWIGSPSSGVPELVRSELGDEAGCLGAALMPWRAADDTTTGGNPCH
ncbi:ROK family protein [Streptomyces niveus]|uniref:ROK family protein n=1 Tax=Streptomyces niveus TaxID=193462 RepID=A0ABZ2A0N7_STRNV|nr:ROK family protein [Streptomyces niveus]